MSFRSFLASAAALTVLAVSSAALADGSITVESAKTKFAADRFNSFFYEVKSPRDMATGQASGKRQHAPLCLSKAPSATTTSWFAVVTTNEVLKSVTLDDGNLRIKLSNATVSSMKFFEKDGKQLEEVCFTYQSIELTHPKSGGISRDDWKAVQ